MRPLLAAALVALVALSGLWATGAESREEGRVSFRTASPASIDVTRSRRADYSVTATNPADSEKKVYLSLDTYDYPNEYQLLGARFGYGLPQPRVEGPGTAFSLPRFIDVANVECGRRLEFHGGLQGTVDVTLDLPPRSTTTVFLPYRLTGRPWPDSDYRLRGTASVEDAGDVGGATARRVRLRFAKPEVRGRTGVRIGLRVKSPRRLVRGAPLVVSGRTLPRLRRRVLLIRYLRTAAPSRILTLARVRTDRSGRFRKRVAWPARRRGRYEVWIRFRGQGRRGPLGDYSCAWHLRGSEHRRNAGASP